MIYLIILSTIFLILKTQKIRDRKRKKLEEEIASLQIKSIKNQVDPHFVFNAVNTMSAMMMEGESDEAELFVSRFSDFMRKTLKNSDTITTSLQEEINYVEDYIKLQLIRFDYIFSYQIEIDSKVDLKKQVPKHVLYTYVENAIKHGLAGCEGNGILQLKISKYGRKLVLEITNSIPANYTTDEKLSTGSGLKIMDQIYFLFNKVYKTKIIHRISNEINSNGRITGKKVTVEIQ